MMWVIMISADDQLTDVRWCVGLTTNTDACTGVCGSLSVSLVSSSAEESSQQHLSGSSDFCYAVWSCRLTAAVMCIYWEVLVLFAEGLQFAAGMKTSGRTESLGGKSAQRNNTLESSVTLRDLRRHDEMWDMTMINIDQIRTLLLTLVQWVILRNSVVTEEGGGSAVHCIDFTHQILMTTLWNVNKCSSWHCRYSSWSLLRK